MKLEIAKNIGRWIVWLFGIQLLVSAVSADETDWLVDLDEAKQVAQKNDKPLMLVFR